MLAHPVQNKSRPKRACMVIQMEMYPFVKRASVELEFSLIISGHIYILSLPRWNSMCPKPTSERLIFLHLWVKGDENRAYGMVQRGGVGACGRREEGGASDSRRHWGTSPRQAPFPSHVTMPGRDSWYPSRQLYDTLEPHWKSEPSTFPLLMTGGWLHTITGGDKPGGPVWTQCTPLNPGDPLDPVQMLDPNLITHNPFLCLHGLAWRQLRNCREWTNFLIIKGMSDLSVPSWPLLY